MEKTDNALAPPSPPSPPTSLRVAPDSTLQTAIRGTTDEGVIIRRLGGILANVFEPPSDEETRLNARAEFVLALREYPHWAVMRAFDTWSKTMPRRPSPAEIRLLVHRELEPYKAELKRRETLRELKTAEERAPAPCSPEAAQNILARAGFTPKRMEALTRAPMARSFEEAEAKRDAPPSHWSEKAGPDSPEMRQLRAARDANPLVQAARDAQRRVEEAQDQQEQR